MIHRALAEGSAVDPSASLTALAARIAQETQEQWGREDIALAPAFRPMGAGERGRVTE